MHGYSLEQVHGQLNNWQGSEGNGLAWAKYHFDMHRWEPKAFQIQGYQNLPASICPPDQKMWTEYTVPTLPA